MANICTVGLTLTYNVSWHNISNKAVKDNVVWKCQGHVALPNI